MTDERAGAPLTIQVARLLSEGPGAVRDYAVSDVFLDLDDEGVRLNGPIEGRIHLGRTNRGLLVDADFTARLEAECSRCLRTIEIPLELRIEEEALPSLDLQTGQPLDTTAEPDALRLSDHHELDLEPLVRDAILLDEPIAALCEEACPGLCTICGERLTTGPHEHEDDPIDPRLEALRAFRVDGEGETG